MRKLLSFAVVLASSAAAACGVAAEVGNEGWSHWRGPEVNGASTTANPPTEWSEEKNVKWKVEVPGNGSSTPIVIGDRIYLHTAVKTDRVDENAVKEKPQEETGGRRRRFGGGSAPTNFYEFWVLAYNKSDGSLAWGKKVTEEVPHEAGHNTNNFASSSPSTDGQRLYSNFGSRGIYCLDLDGNVLWSRDFGAMRTVASFGEGSSSAVKDGVVIVPWDHEGESFLAALDAVNGEVKWKVQRDEGTTWATPLITEYNGSYQVVTNGAKRVRSYDLQSGELLWECGGQASNPIPSPVRYEDNVICMTGYRGYSIYSIPLGSSGDITDTDKPAWKGGDAAPYVPSPVLYDGQLYYLKANNGVLVSRRADTGEVVIPETRLPNIKNVYSSPVAADGKIYITDREGSTIVLKHGSEFEVLANNKLDAQVDGSLAFVGDEVFVRSWTHLYCIAE